MKGLADENFPLPIVRALRDQGWDIICAADIYQGAGDREIYEVARREGRILLTFDKDFGDLYRLSPLTSPSGLVLFRIRRPTSPDARRRIIDVLMPDQSWAGKFSVVGLDRVRVASGLPAPVAIPKSHNFSTARTR